MQKIYYVFFLALFVICCKQSKSSNTETEKEIEKQLSPAEKIAKAHGYDHWNEVNEIAFNFNEKRSWKWNPKTNDVSFIQDSTIIQYNRSNIDSSLIKIDQGFINDKYWLLVPFQLVWDKGASITSPTITKAPISNDSLNKITITYSNSGGYTPGDAYDIFYDDDYIIREWIFRKGNQDEPSLITTFENYQDFSGIKIALEHKNIDGNWNLKFSDIKITLK